MKTDFKKRYAPNALSMPDVKKRIALLNKIAARIRTLLPATEAQVSWSLREFKDSDVSATLRLMMGSRVGRETTGEVVVSHYDGGGSEVYALRSKVKKPAAAKKPAAEKKLSKSDLLVIQAFADHASRSGSRLSTDGRRIWTKEGTDVAEWDGAHEIKFSMATPAVLKQSILTHASRARFKIGKSHARHAAHARGRMNDDVGDAMAHAAAKDLRTAISMRREAGAIYMGRTVK